MINNIALVKPLLDFSEKGDFYMLYVLKRKKDQPEGERDNHQSVRTIKTYCIESLEHLDRRYEEVKMLCEVFKARAYIHVQKQNHKDISLEMLSTLATRIKDGAVNQKGLFDSVVGKIPGREKRWVVDIDNISAKYLLEVLNVIDTIKPVGDKVLKVLPTKNGWHAITSRFDTREFSERFPQIDVQKKNPTLLYYPDSLGLKVESCLLKLREYVNLSELKKLELYTNYNCLKKENIKPVRAYEENGKYYLTSKPIINVY